MLPVSEGERVGRSRIVAWMAAATLVLVATACNASGAATRQVGLQLPIIRGTPPVATTTTTTTTIPPSTTSTTSTTAPVPIVLAPGWSVPLATLPPGGGFTSVSCISDTFCIATGGGANQSDATGTVGAGETRSWDGEAWSNPSVYFPAPTAGANGLPIMPTITCIGGPFCVIADGSGFVANGDGTDWIAPVPLKPAPALATNPSNPGNGHPGAREVAVSCATRKFCTIVDNSGNAYTWKDGSWLAPQAFGSRTGPDAVALYASGRVGVSCPTTSACTAVIGTAVLDWNGTTWSEESLPWTPTLAGPSHRAASVSGNPTAISCATSTLCAIVNGSGTSYRNGTPTWSSIQTIDPAGMLDSISCPQVSFCMAADTDGFIVTWDGKTWAPPIKVIPVGTDYTGIGTTVSCSSANFCMVINGDGDYATYSGPTDG